ncbi:MAG TPA: DUF222 domain-containing protein, partial [Streptosporangiaceae bacterium]|nr:DUF222 domain-containing protein [Streptosporangiaceae bacterium]
MSATTDPATGAEAWAMLESSMRFLAAEDISALPAEAAAERLQALERHDAIEAAVRGRLLVVFHAQDGPVADGQRSIRSWLIHTTGVTAGQAGEHQAVQAIARDHPVLHAALAEGGLLTKSVAIQLAKWTRHIPEQCRDKAEELLAGAALAGVGLRDLAAMCAEILARTAGPDPDGKDPGLDRGLTLATTFDGAGVIHGDLTPECTAMVQSVLDALAAPQGANDERTRPQRYHDALEEAMKRLLASDLLPKRAGQPVKALVHIYFAELLDLDHDGILQDKWLGEYRARWAAHRAASSVSPGDGGAWLDGGAARMLLRDAILIPVVTGDIDPGAIDDLIALCVSYHQLRTQTPPADPDPGPATQDAPAQDQPATLATAGPVPAGLTTAAARQAALTATVTDALADLEQQILGTILQVVSGPGGAASFLRRNLLGKPLAGPSLPLDVGQTDDIPIHLRRLVTLRDQHCQYPGGCDQPAVQCEPHHVIHRKDGGPTSLTNLKDYCWWHHHVVLHDLGWTLT